MIEEKDDKSEGGKSAGGFARSEKLSPERRKEIARMGAEAKKQRRTEENAKLPRATHSGVITLGESKIDCYVLEDGRRLLTQESFLTSMGRAAKAKGGHGVRTGVDTLPPFLAAKNLKSLIEQEISVSTTPVKFIAPNGSEVNGYQAELLPEVCRVYLLARDTEVLLYSQEHIAQRAEILVRALASLGIVALVDEATKFQATRPQDALQRYLEMLVRKELAVWVKKFPDEFYENIYKLRGWVWPGMNKNRYSVVAYYTRDLVYERMAPGLLNELSSKAPKDNKGNREGKLHQLLTEDVGDPMLASQLQSLLTLQRLSIINGWGWTKFMNMVDQVMPKKGQTLMLPLGDSNEAS